MLLLMIVFVVNVVFEHIVVDDDNVDVDVDVDVEFVLIGEDGFVIIFSMISELAQ